MSSSDAEPTSDTTESQPATEPESPVGNLTIEDDPEGTVDPADLAGTASDDDADVS